MNRNEVIRIRNIKLAADRLSRARLQRDGEKTDRLMREFRNEVRNHYVATKNERAIAGIRRVV